MIKIDIRKCYNIIYNNKMEQTPPQDLISSIIENGTDSHNIVLPSNFAEIVELINKRKNMTTYDKKKDAIIAYQRRRYENDKEYHAKENARSLNYYKKMKDNSEFMEKRRASNKEAVQRSVFKRETNRYNELLEVPILNESQSKEITRLIKKFKKLNIYDDIMNMSDRKL